MHALVQALQTVIVALAAAVFAHLGVSLKEGASAPKPPPPPVVHRTSVALQTGAPAAPVICRLRRV
jgi:hypothetical protein